MDLELKTRVELLECNRKRLPPKDQDFAQSLCFQFKKKGDLSPKQALWVAKLLDHIFDVPADKLNIKKMQADLAVPEVAMNFANVFQLFAHAGQALKKPSISLKTVTGLPLLLKPAGVTSKNPGAIYVICDSAHANKTYYGKICPDGSWVPSKQIGDQKQPIEDFLCHLNLDPAAVAAAYGHATNHCCFCKKALTDPKSQKAGYGPTCAAHYNLPWGA